MHNTNWVSVRVIYRYSNMQRLRTILHLFEYTTSVLSLWYVECSNMQWHRRYCTFWNTQHQISPCDNYIRRSNMQRHRAILHLFENTTRFFVLVIYQMQQHRVCACDISDAAICNDLSDILPFWVNISKDIGDIATFLYTPPVLSLRHIRCSNMQRHRAILHLFEYTTPVLSLWHIGCSNMQKLRRYCTFWIHDTTPYARSFRRRFFAFHYAVNHPHTNIFLSWFSIPLVLKCVAKILKIGLQIKI